MNTTDYVTALARLLSSQALRRQFKSDPQGVADALKITEPDREYFVTLMPEQIDSQAALLLSKRKREVYKIMPQTFKQLGKRLASVFMEYANGYWPGGHHRHMLDAFQFCRYLKKHNLPFNHSEFNHIKFLRSRNKIGVAVAKDVTVNGRYYPAIQFFYRLRGITGQYRLYLKG